MSTTELFHKMNTITNSYRDSLNAANSYTDPEKTPAAIHEHQLRMRTEAQQAHIREAELLIERTSAAAKQAVEAADLAASKIPTEASLVADEWKLAVLPLLEGGKPWGSILPELNAEGLAAVERFAPAYERGKSGRGDVMDKHKAETAVQDILGRVKDHRWNLVQDEAGAKAVATARVAVSHESAAREFARNLPMARQATELSGTVTYLTTLSSPAFGSTFARALQDEAAAN